MSSLPSPSDFESEVHDTPIRSALDHKHSQIPAQFDFLEICKPINEGSESQWLRWPLRLIKTTAQKPTKLPLTHCFFNQF
jgi:hypothetical protein